jgi:hypothetical protein
MKKEMHYSSIMLHLDIGSLNQTIKMQDTDIIKKK